jgi:hypothetical protein
MRSAFFVLVWGGQIDWKVSGLSGKDASRDLYEEDNQKTKSIYEGDLCRVM